MTRVIKAKTLILLGHAHLDEAAQDEEYCCSHCRRVGCRRQSSFHLNSNQSQATAIQKAAIPCKDTCEARANEAANSMTRKRIQAVVHPVMAQLEGRIDQDTPTSTHQQGCHGRHVGCCWRNDDEPNNGSGYHARCRGRALVLQALEQGPSNQACCRSCVGIHKRQRGRLVSSQGRATVESGPAKPEQSSAEDSKGDAVRHRLSRLSMTQARSQ
mmetsp:Transcript_144718/g.360775  ORF Transcript_144718/g.360775 Transcript_144718/m.360775 type:complete len:214 (+) Transcript_144718:589-1230(+)